MALAPIYDMFIKNKRNNATTTIDDNKTRKAKVNLLTSNDSISEIAQRVGMANTPYFIKVFRQHYGSSPNHYRKNIKSKG